MIKDEQLKQIAERAGIKPEDFISAIKSEEDSDFAIPDEEGQFIANENLELLKTNLGKQKYEEGKTAGSEMLIKQGKEICNLDFEGKSIENLVDAAQQSVSKDATERERELQVSLEKLQDQYKHDIESKEKRFSELSNRFENVQIRSTLTSEVPELETLKPDQFLTLAEARYDFGKNESGQIVVKDKASGSVMKDKYENPLLPKDVLTDFATNNGWMQNGGRGSSDYSGAKKGEFKDKNEAFAHMEKNGIDPTSEQGQKILESFEKNE